MIDDALLLRLVELAGRLADAAGAAALPWFRRTGLAVENKAEGGRYDPVTEADRAAEAAIRRILQEERPEDGILGEEQADRPGHSGLTWVIDPIDGTRAFVAGLPSWTALIGLDDGEAGRIGLIDQPYVAERFVGWVGSGSGGAELRRGGTDRPIRVRPCGGLGEAVMLTTAPELFEPTEWPAFAALKERCRLTRYGTDAYGYAMVAAGQADLVVESGLAAYDIAAPAALIRAAGGIVTDWQGGDPRWGGRVVAAGDAGVHRTALEALSRVPEA